MSHHSASFLFDASERRLQRRHERLRLLQCRVVCGVVDDVELPSKAPAGFFRDRQRRRSIVSTPDERRRHGDACKEVGRNRRRPELLHQAAQRRQTLWGIKAVEVVRLDEIPLLSHASPQRGEVEDTLVPEAVVRECPGAER